MAKVELKHLTKKFGGTVGVKDLNIKIKDKDFVVLLGPSGCGKTTTLRLIAGLEKATEGTIKIGNRVVDNLDPGERDIAMVFQSYAIYPHMTAFENIAFPLETQGVPKKEKKQRVREAARVMGIEDLLDRKPRTMSGGQRQRVALGRAIVRKPDAFLMDEPLSNLDARLRIHMRAELKKLHERLNATTIYVTHDQTEAMTLADKIALLENGKLQQYSSPEKIYDCPANKFVGTFVGDIPMNFFEGSIVEKNSSLIIDTSYFKVEADKKLVKTLKDNLRGSEVVLGVRGEDMKIGSGQDGFSCEGEVYVTESLGNENIVNVKLSGNKIIKIRTGKVSPSSGDKISFTISKDDLHIFDKKTGRAIF